MRSLTVFVIALIVSTVQTFGQQQPAAIIHVYRANAHIKGIMLHPSVYCDGAELTRLYRGTFFTAKIPPGKHLITLGRTEVGQLIDLESGKDYYFRFGHKNIFVTSVSGREPLTLSLVPEDEARSEMQGLKDGGTKNLPK